MGELALLIISVPAAVTFVALTRFILIATKEVERDTLEKSICDRKKHGSAALENRQSRAR